MTVGEMLAHLATSTYWAQQLHFVEQKSNVGMEDFSRYMAGEQDADREPEDQGRDRRRARVARERLRGQDRGDDRGAARRTGGVSASGPAAQPQSLRDAPLRQGARDAPSRTADADGTDARYRPAPDPRAAEPVSSGRRQTADGRRQTTEANLLLAAYALQLTASCGIERIRRRVPARTAHGLRPGAAVPDGRARGGRPNALRPDQACGCSSAPARRDRDRHSAGAPVQGLPGSRDRLRASLPARRTRRSRARSERDPQPAGGRRR